MQVNRRMVSVGEVRRDPANRQVDETGESFAELVDSVRVHGVLQALLVVHAGDGLVHLVDGERRWRAARAAGLVEVPCDVWPDGTKTQDLVAAGVALNEHRQAHSCLQVARRLRQLKNEFGLTANELAGRTGIAADRVKTYLALWQASDFLLGWLEKRPTPLAVAARLSALTT